VDSSCEFSIEPTGSMKCWETIEWPRTSKALAAFSLFDPIRSR
jgi:hypothetical protein